MKQEQETTEELVTNEQLLSFCYKIGQTLNLSMAKCITITAITAYTYLFLIVPMMIMGIITFFLFAITTHVSYGDAHFKTRFMFWGASMIGTILTIFGSLIMPICAGCNTSHVSVPTTIIVFTLLFLLHSSFFFGCAKSSQNERTRQCSLYYE